MTLRVCPLSPETIDSKYRASLRQLAEGIALSPAVIMRRQVTCKMRLLGQFERYEVDALAGALGGACLLSLNNGIDPEDFSEAEIGGDDKLHMRTACSSSFDYFGTFTLSLESPDLFGRRSQGLY